MSLSYEYRYVSTGERFAYIQHNKDERIFNAFSLLTDGAAQADLWRMIVLYNEGGVYMDIDACLIRPLSSAIAPEDEAVYLWIDKNNEFTNYFIASAPKNPVLKNVIDHIVLNIENRHTSEGVYGMTGPRVFSKYIDKGSVQFFERKYLCIQGAFTNEYFQYMDRPRSKWTHKKSDELLI
jgi:mannosyltransferase OCH1-like enzyme